MRWRQTWISNPPSDHLAKVVLEHIQHVDVISPPLSPSQSYSKTLQTAKDFDLILSLTPSKTILDRWPMGIPPKPVTYVHRHPDSYTNVITAKEEATRIQRLRWEYFLDAFYYECGFRTWYQRSDYVAGRNPSNDSSDFESAKAQQGTQVDRKTPTRYDAVMNALPRISNMTKQEARYLVGRLSRRDSLHESHHRMGMRAMAVYLERLSKQWTEERKNAVLKAFRWLTDYTNYPAAYNNGAEKRQFSDRGILPAINSLMFQMTLIWRMKGNGMYWCKKYMPNS